jgi:hypothetical protein
LLLIAFYHIRQIELRIMHDPSTVSF